MHLPSADLSPSAQVQLAEAVLRPQGSAVAGVPAVGWLQLRPGDLRGGGGAAADAGAAHRHQAVAVWVREQAKCVSVSIQPWDEWRRIKASDDREKLY